MKRRSESFFGLHFDFHAQPKYGTQGVNLREEDIREICRTVKPDFIQIDCKGHPGWTSYPSALGNAMPDFAQDTLALWRRVTREEDVALYMHYSGVFDLKYCAEHPEDVVMNADGSMATGATRLDSKYVDILLIPQLSELVEKYGVDGVWIDGDCWKAYPDFHPETLAAFETETGLCLNGTIPATPADPYFYEYREYHRELYRRYLRHYVDVMHEKYPNFQIASNWAFSDHMPEKVTANVDFLSGDLNPTNSINSSRYGARALAQQEHPWDLMSWNFRRAVGGRGAVVAKHPRQIMQEAATVIAQGGAYQNYIMQYFDGSPNMTDIRSMTSVAEFLRARQPFCFHGKAIHQAALLLSTYDRAIEAKNLYTRTGFQRVMGMSALLGDVGQCFEIVCEHTLEKYINEYKMIVVPELYKKLSDKTVQDLLAYAKAGGKLVLTGRRTCRFFAANGAPFVFRDCDEFFGMGEKAYDNGGDAGHADTSTQKHKPYYFTVDEKTFGIAFSPCAIETTDGKIEAYLTEALQGERLPLAVTVPYGEGSVTAIGFDVGLQYLTGEQYMQRDLLRGITERLYTPMVRLESVCGKVELVPLCKDGKLMLQLVNVGGSHTNEACATDDYIPPVLDLALSIEMEKAPQSIRLQPEGKELPFRYVDGRVYVSVDRVDIHSVLEFR